MLKTALKAIWLYIRDWKNLLTHTLIGLAILAIAFYLPVNIYLRLAILVVVVTLNILRMRYEKKSVSELSPEAEQSSAE